MTDEVVNELTQEYKLSKSSVWNRPFIKDALMLMSHSKCAYCEVKLDHRGSNMEVEHYHPKSLYENEVVEWSNLLPSCKRCNASKGSHDTKAAPIVNPFIDDPRDHLELKQFRYNHITGIGKTTKEELNLNDVDIQRDRFLISLTASQTLEKLSNLLEQYLSGNKNSTRTRNNIVRGIEILLHEAGPESEYSAIVSTTLLSHELWTPMEEELKAQGLWSQMMEDRKNLALSTAYI
ncbi:HNH endonuclease [Deinococcus terrestris]|uniref:HNH endonuclease n=1 Tax=Deinococcus terrestris TaxID=2651870 RepID=UPI0018839CDA|nr:HNH endonuclease [Deinococcus terrestris]